MKSTTSLRGIGILFCLLLTACAHHNENEYEQSALKFLYSYMPLSDSIDYDAGFYLMNIRAARQAAREMPWGETVPESLFRHFVLPVRVNNEHLDSARTLFYDQLKERVRHLSMADAILEVNHWCHEKVVYQPTDARTSSPLATMRTAYGRCGEESTFLVAALRSVGIPARQVYTPRWAHTDDNHAWVEAWADGKWYFLGACEPEPVLNLGWFNAPASRGMLMNAKVFGDYDSTEEVLSATPNTTEVNVTAHYAPVARGIVIVKDESGSPVLDAQVEFKLYNYAEFYTVATKRTDTHGACSLTAGRGDMLIWASKGDRFGFGKLSFGKQEHLTVVLNRKEGDHFAEEIDIVPPLETANLPEVTPGQRAENDRQMAYEDSIRHAYEATMPTEESAATFVASLAYRWSDDRQPQRLAELLVASRGNHAILERFMRDAAPKERALMLLEALSPKDLRDVRIEVLTDHLQDMTNLNDAALTPYIYSPRISVEELTPYRAFFRSTIDPATAGVYRADPQKLVEWCRQNITLADARNAQRVPVSPAGVWRSRRADTRSRNIFFVAVARSLHIPAWIDSVTGTVCYQHPGGDSSIYNVDFEESKATVPPTGRLLAAYTPTSMLDNPKYETHFTLSKIEQGKLQLQNYNGSWESLLHNGTQMPVGYYLLTTGARLANGSVLAHVSSFNIEQNADTRTALVMREDKNQVAVIGSFNSESLFTPLDSDTRQSLLQACGRGYFVVGVLGAGQEPTNHALRDIAAMQSELEKWGCKLVLLFTDKAQARTFRRNDFKNLPATVVYGIDTDGIATQIIENMKLKQGTLPLFIIADTFNRVVFVSQGYTIGLGDQLIKAVRGL